MDEENILEHALRILSSASDFFTVVASSLAIGIFIANRKDISAIFNILLNYTYQLTISELKEKLEKLNDYNADDPTGKEKIMHILNEILGQIKGNDKIDHHLNSLVKEIEKFNQNNTRLNERRKRSFVSELREKLRNLNIKNIDELVGSKK